MNKRVVTSALGSLGISGENKHYRLYCWQKYLPMCACMFVHVHQIGEDWEVQLSGASGVREDPREGTEKREEVARRG